MRAEAYLARARAELRQGEALWLIEAALGHIRDSAEGTERRERDRAVQDDG